MDMCIAHVLKPTICICGTGDKILSTWHFGFKFPFIVGTFSIVNSVMHLVVQFADMSFLISFHVLATIAYVDVYIYINIYVGSYIYVYTYMLCIYLFSNIRL